LRFNTSSHNNLSSFSSLAIQLQVFNTSHLLFFLLSFQYLLIGRKKKKRMKRKRLKRSTCTNLAVEEVMMKIFMILEFLLEFCCLVLFLLLALEA
jgi:hypothetical protein